MTSEVSERIHNRISFQSYWNDRFEVLEMVSPPRMVKNSSSLPVSETFKFFNACEFLEGAPTQL
jgi:hypothetical protein